MTDVTHIFNAIEGGDTRAADELRVFVEAPMKALERKQEIAGFTLIELLVVISIVALLMSIMLPTLQRAKQSAKVITCQANLRQLGLLFSRYAQDHEGRVYDPSRVYPERWFELINTDGTSWTSSLWCCPMAVKTTGAGARQPFAAWEELGYRGSYGINLWIRDSKGTLDRPQDNYWKVVYVKHTDQIPLLTGCSRFAAGPIHFDAPPAFDGDVTIPWDRNSMRRVCLNRHRAMTNGVLLDLSARRIGLKELWTLKWHRNFDTDGPWTRAGGVRPDDWPAWMKQLKDY